MNSPRIWIAIAVLALLVIAAVLWERAEPETGIAPTGATGSDVRVPPTFSEAAKRGAVTFDTTCAACHGINAAGTDVGPPLIHRIYEPSHHSDYAFQL
ncbi:MULTISPECIES: c-type cytochrome [Agrobacterium]|uniref:C-type cytochrome n=1 Tax=Agrobacterium pusense TaxID=648995 RepID=A0AA44EP31_9HYPH|nr:MULTISPECIES: c-type cytochrome [Agrobacterium]NRF11385.1 c-type cytochrome [Agrobacterium pusense]NRF22095.1 c-type cytochrome [Agrobacterium pusense]